jgi:outer membrane protein TolC
LHIALSFLHLQQNKSLLQILLRRGTNTYVEVLKAQEDLLTAQITEAQNHYEGIQALINLYTALGGF